jgi:hypothetical protein
MSTIQDIDSGTGVYWEDEKDKINANFAALNDDKVEESDVPSLEEDPIVGAITGLVKADGAGNISAAVADTDYQSVPSEGAFEDGDKTKLDAIEAGADVTDATNVTAAGALMDSEVTNLAAVKAFDPDDYATPTDLSDGLALKVDIDGSKVLSDVNYSAADKALVDTIVNKVNASGDKVLSDNNFTDALKTKVDNCPADTTQEIADLNEALDEVLGVQFYEDYASFPGTGTEEIIYIAQDTGYLYEWIPNEYQVLTVPAYDGDIADLDIDGGTDIGAALADADLIIVDDGAGGTNRKSALSRIWTYILAKIVAVTDVSSYGFVIDEDTMVSDDATKVPTQQSVKAYVDAAGGGWDGDIADIDLDGGSDIGAALADADLILVDDGAGGTNRKSAISRVWTYILAKIVAVVDVSTYGWVVDEDDMASDSALKVPTQQSVKAYVDDLAGGAITVNTYSTNQLLTAAQCYGNTIYVTGAATITLPAVVDGMHLKIITRGAVAVNIDPNGSEVLVLDNTSCTGGHYITNNSTNGDWAELTYDDQNSETWIVTTNGWSEESE